MQRNKQSEQFVCWLLNHSQYAPELALAGWLPRQQLPRNKEASKKDGLLAVHELTVCA